MRKRIFLVPFMFAITMFSIAQSKNDNTIIVNGYVKYEQIKEALTNEGFIVSNSDTSVITTNFKAIGMAAAAYSTPGVAYLIKRTDTSVIFRGYVNNKLTIVIGVDITAHSWPLENWGEKKGAFRMGFAMMGKIASSFGLPVTYLKEDLKKGKKNG